QAALLVHRGDDLRAPIRSAESVTRLVRDPRSLRVVGAEEKLSDAELGDGDSAHEDSSCLPGHRAKSLAWSSLDLPHGLPAGGVIHSDAAGYDVIVSAQLISSHLPQRDRSRIFPPAIVSS